MKLNYIIEDTHVYLCHNTLIMYRSDENEINNTKCVLKTKVRSLAFLFSQAVIKFAAKILKQHLRNFERNAYSRTLESVDSKEQRLFECLINENFTFNFSSSEARGVDSLQFFPTAS